jgi:hypothetical protein
MDNVIIGYSFGKVGREGTNRKMKHGSHRDFFRIRLVPRCHCVSLGFTRAIIGQR